MKEKKNNKRYQKEMNNLKKRNLTEKQKIFKIKYQKKMNEIDFQHRKNIIIF